MIARARTYQRGLYVAPLCIALALACWTAMPSFAENPAATAPSRSGIISGTVTASADVIRVGGRRVHAVNLSTGHRASAITAGDGAFTIVAEPGRYRIELDHSPSETISRLRGDFTLGTGDLQADVDIRISNKVAAPITPRIYQPPLPTRAPIV